MADTVECVVVGAGIIGLAVARALALQGREVLVLEQERCHRRAHLLAQQRGDPCRALLSRGQPQGAVLRRRQPAALRLLRRARHTAKRIGKLVVAVDEREAASLAGLMAKAAANGVGDLELLGGQAARALEPDLSCVAAFHSPSTGIIDSHALMLGYQGDAENAGARLALRAELLSGRVDIVGLRARGGRRRQDRARMQDPGQCRRALRAVPGAAPRRRAARNRSRAIIIAAASISRCRAGRLSSA